MEPVLVPLWLKLAYGAFVPFLIVVYWREYGPSNFLWLSDIALFLTAAAVIFESPLLASMPAVGVLPLEIVWTVDFLIGGRLGLTSYMFQSKYPLWLRAISLFHLALPPTILWLLWKLGYVEQAYGAQLGVLIMVLVLCYNFTPPKLNINWVFGPGEKPQKAISPIVYFALLFGFISLIVMVPMHYLLKWLF
jgi:hypothetical protein